MKPFKLESETAKKPKRIRQRKHPRGSESQIQKAIVTACHNFYASLVKRRFFAIPNGWGIRGGSKIAAAIQGARLKREGVKAGTPDMFFWRENGRAMWLELKTTKGKTSPDQKAMHEALRANGHLVVVPKGYAEAIEQILKFYSE